MILFNWRFTWDSGTDDDKKVIYNEKRFGVGSSGVSSRGTSTNDNYTLKGFTAAFNQLNKDC